MTDFGEWEAKIREVLRQNFKLFVPVEELATDAELLYNGLNSVDFINLVVEIEKEFSLRVDAADLKLDNFKSISEILNFISYQKEKAGIHAVGGSD
ncbi:phosphopantetheine-binding protein [Paenibacillus sp. FJAT-26967]|uniref:phosphopantetheine-binding protein n=1 Tax=Paenibacillus sp. FJAT-26967 TaxID=1729690 RepID=UPI0008396666|nr:phosphopantetheine-binding protein [Paenibacillus sp. FJAT-26967]